MLLAIIDTMDTMVMAEDTIHMVVGVVTAGDTATMLWYSLPNHIFIGIRASSP